MLRKSLTLAVMVAAATPAYAGDKYVVQPLPLGQVNVRYYKGTPTVALTQKDGMVQIVPLSFDHGSISFSLAVFNDGEAPANIDLANLIVTIDGRPVAKLSRQALERKAKNRAMWQQIGIGLAGGLAAAAAASQRDHYRATTFTPYGTYSTFVSAPSRDGQLTGALLAAGTGAGIYAVQKKLEATLDALGDQIVQTTTVDGRGGSYAGRVVLEKVKLPPRGIAKMELVVLWNGQKYPFLFQVAPNGTPMPVFDNPPPVAATTAEPIAPAGAPAPIAAPAAAPPVAPPPAAPSAASSAATVG